MSAHFVSLFSSLKDALRFAPARRSCAALLKEALQDDYDRILLLPSPGPEDAECRRLRCLAEAMASRHCLVLASAELYGFSRCRRKKDDLYLFPFYLAGMEKLLLSRLTGSSVPVYLWLRSDGALPSRALRQRSRILCDVAMDAILEGELSPLLTDLLQDPAAVFTADSTSAADLLIVHRGTGRMLLLPPGTDVRFQKKNDPSFRFDDRFSALCSDPRPLLLSCLRSFEDPDDALLTALASTGRFQVAVLDHPPSPLPQTEGLHYLGPRDDSVLRFYARAADALLLPYRLPASGTVFPPRLYDLLAAGPPVLVLNRPFCASVPGVCSAAGTEDVLQALDRELGDAPFRTALREHTAAENDWSRRAASLCTLLSSLEIETERSTIL